MSKKIIIITGASDGIGKISVREIAKLGYKIVLVARNSEKIKKTIEEIKSVVPDADLDFRVCDLSLLKETKVLAEDLKKSYPKIDVLLNNAGAFFNKRQLTSEGLESTFALNHMNYFILASVLLPNLEASGAGRIVNVASMAHQGAHLDFENLQGELSYSGWSQYQRSKLMNIYFTYELEERLHANGSKVTVNCLHPGFVKTKFGHNNEGIITGLLKFAQNIFAISEDAGAKTQIYLSTSTEVEGKSGLYFDSCKPKKSSRESYDLDARHKLWSVSEDILSKI